MRNKYTELCTGCGLCKAINNIEFQERSNGLEYPTFFNSEEAKFCDKVCSMGKNGISKDPIKSIWGNYLSVYEGYATDVEVRKKASSGGVLTALCLYLLDTHIVDGIIHTTYDPKEPVKTINVCSSSRNELIERCGSRYAASSPLTDLFSLIEPGKKYVFVGKPCDVNTLKNYFVIDQTLKNQICYMFSFFCAGTPSLRANKKLIESLGCRYEDCEYLNYRGNGWPGKTEVIDKQGKRFVTDYETSWMNILGRDIRSICKFCFDSIGEKADISCGDLWYLDGNNRPSFEEKDGRNCIFTWSKRGQKLLCEAFEAGYIWGNGIQENESIIGFSQPNHRNRRGTMLGKVIALKLCGKPSPRYSLSMLYQYARIYGIRSQLGACKGTIQRIIKKKL